MSDPATWPWPESMDAAVAAPDSHRVLMETDRVRVVEVVVEPGVREPVHTHRWPGVMWIDRPARIRYYGESGDLELETPEWPEGESATTAPHRTEWMEPEGPHAVENVDEVAYHAIRVELKPT